jgi:hypothetical protein
VGNRCNNRIVTQTKGVQGGQKDDREKIFRYLIVVHLLNSVHQKPSYSSSGGVEWTAIASLKYVQTVVCIGVKVTVPGKERGGGWTIAPRRDEAEAKFRINCQRFYADDPYTTTHQQNIHTSWQKKDKHRGWTTQGHFSNQYRLQSYMRKSRL